MYTLQAQSVAGRAPPLEKYLHAYLRFIERYGHLFEFCAEFDIEELNIEGFGWVTIDQVWEWREMMVQAAPRARICPVWHPESRTRDEWSQVCADPRFPYLGIGGQASLKTDSMVGLYKALISEAHHWDKFVHGYGATKLKTMLPRLMYDSVDSSSWTASQRFGTTYICRNGQMTILNSTQKDERKRYRNHFTRKGVDWRSVEADEAKGLRHAAAVAWRDIGDHYQARRAYLHKKWTRRTR